MTKGRPSDYTPELADIICERIAEGRAVISIAKDEDMPAQGTIYVWLSKHIDFQEKYARARELQADIFAEEILDIADNATNDWMEANGQNDVGFQLNGEHVQRSRLRIDSRKWLASKLKPKKYGDAVNQKHTDGEGKPLVITDKTAAILALLTDEQLEQLSRGGE